MRRLVRRYQATEERGKFLVRARTSDHWRDLIFPHSARAQPGSSLARTEAKRHCWGSSAFRQVARRDGSPLAPTTTLGS